VVEELLLSGLRRSFVLAEASQQQQPDGLEEVGDLVDQPAMPSLASSS